MWPAVIAAAVAASTGLLAKKHVFKPPAEITGSDPRNDAVAGDELSAAASLSSRSPPPMWESDCEDQVKDGIFRFSSDGSAEKKKTRFRIRKKKVAERSKAAAAEMKKMKSGGRRGGVCLKKRRTAKNNSAAPKCGSSSSDSKGTSSLFNWGLNIGIMYMMTAGKAEINKLNTTMDETAKVVQELKSELHKRKASQSQQVSGSVTEASTQYPSPSSKRTQTAMTKSSVENCQPNYMRATSFQVSDYGECASSVLTEEQEPEPEVMDMDQLEAELESELQKLPCCSAEAPHQVGFGILGKDISSEVSAENSNERYAFDAEQFHGVLPAELDQKLCHVLIEQQENQIGELEFELQSAQSKLQEKETELQALKDCVKRLTQLSISTVSDDETEAHIEQEGFSDDETEAHIEQEQNTDWNYKTVASESIIPVVGMKRTLASVP